MKMWNAPVAIVEQFVSNDYIATCVTYDFKCNVEVGKLTNDNGHYGNPEYCDPLEHHPGACGKVIRVPAAEFDACTTPEEELELLGPLGIKPNRDTGEYLIFGKQFQPLGGGPVQDVIKFYTADNWHFHYVRGSSLEDLKVTSTFS